jgi:hypothetical protein
VTSAPASRNARASTAVFGSSTIDTATRRPTSNRSRRRSFAKDAVSGILDAAHAIRPAAGASGARAGSEGADGTTWMPPTAWMPSRTDSRAAAGSARVPKASTTTAGESATASLQREASVVKT